MAPSSLFYYLDDQGRQQGPYRPQKLGNWLVQGVIRSDTPVWTEGWPTWRPAGEVGALIPVGRPNRTTSAAWGAVGGVAVALALVLIICGVLSDYGAGSGQGAERHTERQSDAMPVVPTTAGGQLAPPSPPGAQAAQTGSGRSPATVPTTTDNCPWVAVSWQFNPSAVRYDNPFMQPDQGNQFAAVWVTVTNHGYPTVPVNPLYFTLKSGQTNVIYDCLTFAKVEQELQCCDLGPGETVAGNVVAEVPAGETVFSLTFQPMVFGSEYKVVYGP